VLPGAYEPRATIETVLHEVVRLHLDRFLTETAATDGAGLPGFIAREFRPSSGAASSRAASPGCGATRAGSNVSFRVHPETSCVHPTGRTFASANVRVDADGDWVRMRSRPDSGHRRVVTRPLGWRTARSTPAAMGRAVCAGVNEQVVDGQPAVPGEAHPF
jgi:hypothetical protein